MEQIPHKLLVARAQLGAATQLFLQDMDPASVHVLACGAGEVLEGLAGSNGHVTVASVILSSRAYLTPAKLIQLRNEKWNAMKHFSTRAGAPRADEPLLSSFSDKDNDSRLFEAWFHYGQLRGSQPLDAHLLEMWVLHSSGLLEGEDQEICGRLFPDQSNPSRSARKDQLRKCIARMKQEDWTKVDGVEHWPLLLSRQQFQALQISQG